MEIMLMQFPSIIHIVNYIRTQQWLQLGEEEEKPLERPRQLQKTISYPFI